MDIKLEDFLETFSNITKKPTQFLSAQDSVTAQLKDLTKQLYDFTKCKEQSLDKKTIPKLIIDNFDEEQIWQELELQNTSCTNGLIPAVAQLAAKQDRLKYPLNLKCLKEEPKEPTKVSSNDHSEKERVQNEFDENSEFIEEDEEEEDFSDLSEENLSETETDNKFKKGKLKPSIVDDKFFKLSELELYLQNEEKRQDKPEKESFDLFENTDKTPADYKYSDFFENPEDDREEQENQDSQEVDDEDFEGGSDQDLEESDQEEDGSRAGNKTKRTFSKGKEADVNEDKANEDKASKKVRFSLLDSDEEDSDSKDLFSSSKKGKNKSDEIKSSLEERQERLGRVINRLEEEAIAQKSWQLSGEVTGSARPQNSLLQEAVDFDLSMRPAPVITEEVSLRLEDIILQRIKDKAWDDVERKVKPVDTPSEFKKKLALDQEKSKLSLAEVYEQEFIKQREAATADDAERQETEPALHVEVRSMLHSLFNKLDALSNYHYTPRPVAPELKVVSNVPAINMEEVAPVTVADSALLAPQEVKGKKRRAELMSKEERTDTDKKRARRMKKMKQRQRQRERAKAAKDISKLNPGLGNKYSKMKVQNELLDASNITKMEEGSEKVVKSSTAFFSKLQDDVKSQIKSKTPTYAKKKDKMNITAKKLKL